MKLSDTQLVILQSGARDPERLCWAEARLGAAPRGAIARKLISLGLAEAVPAPADAPAEQRFPSSDKAGAAPMLLRITNAGLRAIGVEPEEERRAEAADAPDDALEAAMEAQREARAAEAVASIAANAPRAGRGFWRAAEEAASRGELPPAPDLSAPTHAPYRKKLEKLLALAQAGDAAGLRAVAINPTSTSPKALARWRDLAVRAIETRGAGR
jgi:hypothetical protein